MSTKPQRVIVVTGASSGIGAAAASALAETGAHIVVVGRNPERTAAVAARVGGDGLTADFERLDEVRALAAALLARYERIDALANNAGGLIGERRLTVDGLEALWQSNVVAPFLLTELLTPRLIETAKAKPRPQLPVRIVATASMANQWGRLRFDDLDYHARRWRAGWPAYGSSKLAVILWIRELAERLTGTGVTPYAFHPGVVVTNFASESPLLRLGNGLLGDRWGVTPEKGAAPLVRLLTDPSLEAPPGTYFDRLRANGRTAAQGRDPQLARELRAVLARQAGLA